MAAHRILAAAALLAAPCLAQAQTGSTEIVVAGQRSAQQIAVSNQLRNRVETLRNAGEEDKAPDWDLFLGAGVGAGPVALGSSETSVGGVPLIDLRYKDRFFVGTLEGIGAYLVNTDRFLLGASLGGGGAFGRLEEDDEDLYFGLGDLEGGLGVNLFANVTLPLADLGASINHASGGDLDGVSGALYASSTLPLSERLFLTLDLSTTIAEEKIAQAAFGVTPQQAARRATDIAGARPNAAPLRAFSPDGAAIVPAIGMSALYSINQRWTALASVNYQRLEGDVADSPLAPEDEAVSGSVLFVRKMF